MAFARAANNVILKLKRTPGIYLVGFMGCGKSTVGRALAEELGWSHIDLDDEIETSVGVSIAEIFATRGEPEFREIESRMLQKSVHAVQSGRPHVIALGGGAVIKEENFDLISNNGVTVWLDSPFSAILRRVSTETHRPLARDPKQLEQLFEQRRPIYARCHYRIEFEDEDARGAVSKILALPLF